jgi:uncharacterized protein (DUF2235 family)
MAGKSIILFSDGTGNSSAKLFKTNVWRMYEAVDLGPSPEGKRDQISFYDDGVGTSGFRPLAALGGAFGWGLKRNVLDLYQFACRNYRPGPGQEPGANPQGLGDHIYGFGFSRGAFTMRLVIALIASQGLVTSDDEAELDRRSRCAYRAFRTAFLPRKLKRPTRFLRRVRDSWVSRRERRKTLTSYDKSQNYRPVIRFVGVWDTVAAYGGPIAEITRAIDNWIYPLSMPDYELAEPVDCARHALALDDERDSFQPLLWDEVAEFEESRKASKAQAEALERARQAYDRKAPEEATALVREAAGHRARKWKFRKRIQQVWFTGMHADVGGGYPDESLSYISLLWMMEEAEKADLRTLDVIKNRFFALANSFGPLHDSRSGMGAYYRYQPRKIAAWIHPPDRRYLMLQDPDIEGRRGQPQGLLRQVRVHESVIARIDSGTDRYAPIALPRNFDVIPPQKEGETVKQADSDDDRDSVKPGPSEPLVDLATLRRLKAAEDARFACQENLWDIVWRRRFAYFTTLAATLMLAALPLFNPFSAIEKTCSDARCFLPNVIRFLKVLVPSFAEGWIEAIALNPVTAVLLAILVWRLLRWGKTLELRLRDSSHRLWRSALDGRPPAAARCAPTPLRRRRESPAYQRLFFTSKWYLLPGAFGILMLAALLYAPLVVATQSSLAVEESTHTFCRQERGPLPELGRGHFTFDTKARCLSIGRHVRKGQVYDIVLQLPMNPDNGEPTPWWDDNRKGDPKGLSAAGAAQFFGVPMRRVINARYLQPLVEITVDKSKNSTGLGRWIAARLPFVDRVHVRPLELKRDEDFPELYRARFKAPHSGSLQFFANDAQLPFGGGKWIYANNCGTAKVTIALVPRRERRQELIPLPETGIPLADCAKEKLREERNREQATNAPAAPAIPGQS